jgi:hypothetical protein
MNHVSPKSTTAWVVLCKSFYPYFVWTNLFSILTCFERASCLHFNGKYGSSALSGEFGINTNTVPAKVYVFTSEYIYSLTWDWINCNGHLTVLDLVWSKVHCMDWFKCCVIEHVGGIAGISFAFLFVMPIQETDDSDNDKGNFFHKLAITYFVQLCCMSVCANC